MPEVYKILGQIAPTDTTERSLYVSPALTDTLVSNITVTNRSASSQTFDINVHNSAMTQATIDGLAVQRFVSIGTGQQAYHSTDGTTWTATNLPLNTTYNQLIYANGIFFTLNNNSTTAAASSTDGITWTNRTLPSSVNWSGLAYGNGVFCATAYQSTTAATSTDAITWTIRTLPNTTTGVMTFGGNGQFLTVSPQWTNKRALMSTDGITWVMRDYPSFASWHLPIASPNIFVCLTYNSTKAASSTDGITWTERTLPNVGKVWRSGIYGNGRFVVVSGNYGGGFSTSAAISTDGITWTESTLPTNTYWRSIGYGANTFVAVGYNSTTAASSTDGITWTLRTMPSNNQFRFTAGSAVNYVSPAVNNLYKNVTIGANQSEILEPGITLSSQNSIVARGNSSLTFSAYGMEIS